MANQLKMSQITSILTLHESGHSNRKIAELLGVHRETVARYIFQASSKPAKPDPRVRSGPANSCEPFRETILSKLEQGLSGQRIYQDLCEEEQGFTGSYSSVRRFLATLRQTHPLPVRRIETAAGKEAQIDFGTGAWIVDSDGRRRRTWVLRVVLSHSRNAYSESVFSQTTESFILCLENAFAHFGGVTKTLVIDNLIVRKYKGKVVRVLVTEDGFEYEGERYKSLTAVAKAVSGSHCNGFRFFGLEAKQ